MENVIRSNPSHEPVPFTAATHTAATRTSFPPERQPPTMTWSGRVLSGLFALFLVGASAAPKLLQLPVAEQTMMELGWPAGYAFSIGVLELCCVVLYLVPRTSIFGAVLTMGLLGGAMATQLRVQAPLFSHALFSVYVGLFMWGGLWLRSPHLRKVLRFVRAEN
jgi:hypothetical protein